MQNKRAHNNTRELFYVVLHGEVEDIREKKSQLNNQLGLQIIVIVTYHHFNELEIFGIADFANVVEEDRKLREVNCVRQFREYSLDFHLE